MIELAITTGISRLIPTVLMWIGIFIFIGVLFKVFNIKERFKRTPKTVEDESLDIKQIPLTVRPPSIIGRYLGLRAIVLSGNRIVLTRAKHEIRKNLNFVTVRLGLLRKTTQRYLVKTTDFRFGDKYLWVMLDAEKRTSVSPSGFDITSDNPDNKITAEQIHNLFDYLSERSFWQAFVTKFRVSKMTITLAMLSGMGLFALLHLIFTSIFGGG